MTGNFVYVLVSGNLMIKSSLKFDLDFSICKAIFINRNVLERKDKG